MSVVFAVFFGTKAAEGPFSLLAVFSTAGTFSAARPFSFTPVFLRAATVPAGLAETFAAAGSGDATLRCFFSTAPGFFINPAAGFPLVPALVFFVGAAVAAGFFITAARFFPADGFSLFFAPVFLAAEEVFLTPTVFDGRVFFTFSPVFFAAPEDRDFTAAELFLAVVLTAFCGADFFFPASFAGFLVSLAALAFICHL
jgi:hypothetical protein